MRHEAWTRPHDVDDAGLRDYVAYPSPPRPRRSWTWAVVLVAFLVGVLAGAELFAAEKTPAVDIRVRPQVMLQRGDIRVEVRVARATDNRVLAITWDSLGGSAGSTQRPLDGDNAEVLHTLDLRSQPAAHYRFVATVYTRLGKVAGSAQADILVPDDGGAR